jgi:hypothetical protein
VWSGFRRTEYRPEGFGIRGVAKWGRLFVSQCSRHNWFGSRFLWRGGSSALQKRSNLGQFGDEDVLLGVFGGELLQGMPKDAIIINVGVGADDPAKFTRRVLESVTDKFNAGVGSGFVSC